MKKVAWRMIQISLLVLTVLGIVRSVFVSLDIDESYAVAQAYRLVTGDKLLYDMWEPHQFSAFLPAFFLLPYTKIAGGTEYCVIFLRIAGILIHLVIGMFLYDVTKGEAGKKAAFLFMIFHLNFLPKWVCMPEFELMHYWSMLLIFLFLYRHEKCGWHAYPVLAGVAYFVSVLCYPTMIILFPVYLILQYRGKYPVKVPLLFTLGTVIPASILGGWIISYLPISQIKPFVGYILMDSSHTGESVSWKWTKYALELMHQSAAFAICLGIAVVAGLILLLIQKGIRKKDVKFGNVCKTVLFIAVSLLCLNALCGFLFGDQNQFFFQVRYLVLVVIFLVTAIINRKEFHNELRYGIIPVALSLPVIFLITNMDTNTSYAKLMPAVIIGFFMFAKSERKKSEEGRKSSLLAKISVNTAAICLLLCFFVCKLVLIRVTGCLPVTVKAPMARVQQGPAAGIYVLDELEEEWDENYDIMSNFVKKGTNPLYIGAEQLFYVAFASEVTVPSVQGTTVYNEMYETYYEVFPEKKPELIIIDESYKDTPGYFYYPENEFIFNWIDENIEIDREVTIGCYRVLWTK